MGSRAIAGRAVAGRWSLVAGRWSLVAGRWSLVAGRGSLFRRSRYATSSGAVAYVSVGRTRLADCACAYCFLRG
jgi:hypothetical protein